MELLKLYFVLAYMLLCSTCTDVLEEKKEGVFFAVEPVLEDGVAFEEESLFPDFETVKAEEDYFNGISLNGDTFSYDSRGSSLYKNRDVVNDDGDDK